MENGHVFFDRTELLVGAEALGRLRETRVIVFGVGGVGSWCAEALVRSGVGHVTVVDSDCVDCTNVNRQLPALVTTVGRPKVEVMRERLLAVNPGADVLAIQQRYSSGTAGAFGLEGYDYVVDAIDSLADKMDLILRCTSLVSSERGGEGVRLFSSMGAACKMDPLQVRVGEFWKVAGCPLAATLRRRMRREGRFPARKFLCVWSAERVERSQAKGTLMPVTATFGLVLASLVVRDVCQQQL